MASASEPSAPPPVVCTLTTKELAGRRLAWQDLGALAIDRQPIPGGIRTRFAAEHAAAIADLVERERDCCGSWLDLRLVAAPADREVVLEATTTNPEGEATVRSIVWPEATEADLSRDG